MSISDDLYQQVILDHNRRPRNFMSLPPPAVCHEGFNPLCGDHLWVYVQWSDDQTALKRVTFQGSGCAISKASASLMTDAVQGLGVEEGMALFAAFRQMLQGHAPAQVSPELGKLTLFAKIWKYPSRIKCASLGWHAFHAILNGQGTGVGGQGQELAPAQVKGER